MGDVKELDHSLHWTEVKEEAEEFSDIHGVTEQERGHKGKVLPSPVPVKEEETCSLLPVNEEEVALITVKEEENEDWLKSEDEDVVKVSVPWEPLETSPSSSSSCSDTDDTEDSEMESDNVRDCENHEHDVSVGLKIEDCSRTSLDPGTAPGDSKGVSSFYPCPQCALGFTIERFFHGHLKRDHPKDYIAMLKDFKRHQLTHKKTHTGHRPYNVHRCKKSSGQLEALKAHQKTHKGEKPYQCSV
ncbi:hypothetical protein J4Q44_G00204210 [Coregonus suidteri]|uniref:C2H2-type domain-containing protein n=1 Tax=Coregonus suidteri TaxID=861788 RepID=A0AAN8QS48_9TELE